MREKLKKVHDFLRGSKDEYVVRGIDGMNMNACHTISAIISILGVIMIAMLVLIHLSNLNVRRSLVSTSICVVVALLVYYASGKYVTVEAKQQHKHAMAVVMFSLVGMFIWSIYISLINYMNGIQITMLYAVVLCYVCFVRMIPYFSIVVYGAAFTGMYLLMHMADDADGVIFLNYIAYMIMTIAASVINYYIALDMVENNKRNEELMTSLSDMSFHDNLTGLLNRHALDVRTDVVERRMYYVALADINQFKLINDTYGHNAGDKVLIDVSASVLKFFRKNDCYRYGGDEVLIIAENIGRDTFEKRLYNWRKDLSQIPVADSDMKITVSYVTVCGKVKGLDDLFKLVKESEDALKKLKQGDPNARSEEQKIVDDVLQAMEDGNIVAFYQPKVDIRDNSLIGAEALVRWVTDSSIVPPGSFVPILESLGEICKIDMFIFEQVCKDMKRWREAGYKIPTISCNFSMENLNNDNLVEEIAAIAKKYDTEVNKIEIEFTETVNAEELSKLLDIVQRLRAIGFKVAMDDFGTGYSTLSLLRDIPMDVIKLDRTLVTTSEKAGKSIGEDRSRALLKNIINLTKDMQMMCLAEGVETISQREMLKLLGCYYVQGFLYDCPLKVEEFEKRMQKGYYDEIEEMPDADAETADDESGEFPLSVMVVEDNEINCEITKNILEEMGAYVVTAEDGRDAYEKFKNSEENEYDVIFMDIQMPVMDGYEATRSIRGLNRPDAKAVPIIATTADAYKETRAKAEEAGMSDYVLKPLDPKQIREKLERIMDSK